MLCHYLDLVFFPSFFLFFHVKDLNISPFDLVLYCKELISMCIDKQRTAEFLKQSMAGMKAVLTMSNDVSVLIETFQKENAILKAELDRVIKENDELHFYINSIPTFKNDQLSPISGKDGP